MESLTFGPGLEILGRSTLIRDSVFIFKKIKKHLWLERGLPGAKNPKMVPKTVLKMNDFFLKKLFCSSIWNNLPFYRLLSRWEHGKKR